MASIFANVEVGPKIEVFALTKAYQEDPSMVKVNLSVGGKLFTSNGCRPYLFTKFLTNVRQFQVRSSVNFVEMWLFSYNFTKSAQLPYNQLVT